MNVPRYSPRAV